MKTHRTEMMLDMASEGFWEWDLKKDRAFLSPRYCQLIGYSHEDTVFNSTFFRSIIHPDDRDRVCKLVEEYLQGLRTSSFVEYRILTRDNRVRWVEERSKIIYYDESGAPTHAVGTVIDISARKEIENRLRLSEEKFATAFRSSPDAININRLTDGMYIEVNEGFTATSGYTSAEVLGRSSLDLSIWADVKDRDRLVSGLSDHGVVNNFEARFRCKDGSYIDGLMSARIIEVDGEPCVLSITRDITKRKQAEDAVCNLNRLLQTIINTVPARIFWKDAESGYLGCNSAFAKDAGFDDPEELLGKKDDQMGWKDQAEQYRADDRLVIETGLPRLSYEEPQSTPDGRMIWLRTSKVPLRNDSDEIIGVLGIYEDITDRKQVETEKTRLLLRQRAILDNLPMMAWLKDCDSRLEMVNKPFARACGHSVDDCIDKTDLDLFPEELARAYMADDREVCLTGTGKHIEEPITTPEGIRWHLTYKTPLLDELGRTIGTTGIAMDITGRKQAEEALRESEERYRSILRTTMDGFWVIDLQGHLLEVNETICRMTGFNDQELLKKRLSDLEAGESAEEIAIHFNRIISLGEDRFESRLRCKDGGLIDVEISAQFRPIENGRIVAFVRDITRRKLADEELQKKNADMEQFAYTVSHDLRSPLVTIKTFLGYLENDMDDDNQTRIVQDLQYIHGATDKMKLLLDELLELSRIDRTEAEPVNVTLLEVLGEVLAALAGVISEQGVDIRLPDTDMILFGDRPRLCQIWQNLIENAIKYRRDDRVSCIELGTRLIDGETVFFVKDNGIGIEPQYHQKVFGIFEKLDSRSPGAGLGLSMIKRIVEKRGGRVWVESAGSNQGSCFCFVLPEAVRDT
jgi:PAS domain S-box-containing protein